ncbi:MAG: 4Fe-4S dicluster domain-containing protein [Thermoplasmatota archaeon]
MNEKILVINPEKCTGCRTCELMCSLEKGEEFRPFRSRISAKEIPDKIKAVPLTCLQCDDAPCLDICPTGAIEKQDSGLVTIDEDTCIGCKMCAMACPFGVMEIDTDEGGVYKCDQCDGDPVCVKYCPYDALEFGRPDEILAEKKEKTMKEMQELGDKGVLIRGA